MWLKAGSGNYTKCIPIYSIASDKEPDVCKVHSAVHTLTGCDYTSKGGTKQATLKANPVDYLEGFGCSQNGPSDDEVERAESYPVNFLKNATTCRTMDELRDHNYHRSKTSLEKPCQIKPIL